MARLRGKPCRPSFSAGERAGSEIASSESSGTRVWGQRPGQPGEGAYLRSSMLRSLSEGERMRRKAMVLAMAVMLVVAALGLSGCGKKSKSEPIAPQVSPPAIKEAGTLRVGVDLDYPPFAGQDNGQKVGIDIDVASALAERLGLKVVLVEVAPSEAATALADGTADVVMSVPLDQSAEGKVAYGGSYISDAPVLFAQVASGSVEPSLTVQRLGEDTIGAQYGSPAFWYLQDQLGEQYVKGYSTLEEPLAQLVDGSLKIAAGDAVIGAYIARDLANVRVVGQLKPANLIGVGVRSDNVALQEAVRGKLDALAADGVLATIRKKWVADLPKLTLPASLEATATP
jgi:polar amino acid transport system substrate-binding protein